MTIAHRLSIPFALALLSGCSGYLDTEHFELVNDGTLIRYQVHDWYEKETTGPSFGVYRPPIYGFEHAGQIVVVYPVFIQTETEFIGPPVVPFLPTSLFGDPPDDDTMILKVRWSGKEERPVVPSSIRILADTATTIALEKGKTDPVGTLFLAKLPTPSSEQRFAIALNLSDGSSKTLTFVRRRDRFYSPLFSFNGPEPRPSLKKYED